MNQEIQTRMWDEFRRRVDEANHIIDVWDEKYENGEVSEDEEEPLPADMYKYIDDMLKRYNSKYDLIIVFVKYRALISNSDEEELDYIKYIMNK